MYRQSGYEKYIVFEKRMKNDNGTRFARLKEFIEDFRHIVQLVGSWDYIESYLSANDNSSEKDRHNRVRKKKRVFYRYYLSCKLTEQINTTIYTMHTIVHIIENEIKEAFRTWLLELSMQCYSKNGMKDNKFHSFGDKIFFVSVCQFDYVVYRVSREVTHELS